MSRARRFVVLSLVAVGAVVAGGSAFQDSKPAAEATLEDLAFLHGTWRLMQGGAETEEIWLPTKGSMMFGVNRTTIPTKTVAFEYLRIERTKDGINYVAQPNGSPPTKFKLTSIAPNVVVFTNPVHDFPKSIAYAKRADGVLVATLTGAPDKKDAKVVFEFNPGS